VLRALDEVSAYDRFVADYWDSRLSQFIENAERVLVAEQRAGRAPASIDTAMASRLKACSGRSLVNCHSRQITNWGKLRHTAAALCGQVAFACVPARTFVDAALTGR
jgi:hypothetical protein